jgi:hypothetical protein
MGFPQPLYVHGYKPSQQDLDASISIRGRISSSSSSASAPAASGDKQQVRVSLDLFVDQNSTQSQTDATQLLLESLKALLPHVPIIDHRP